MHTRAVLLARDDDDNAMPKCVCVICVLVVDYIHYARFVKDTLFGCHFIIYVWSLFKATLGAHRRRSRALAGRQRDTHTHTHGVSETLQ